MHFQFFFVVALSSIILSSTVTGFPLSQFYPFDSTAGDSSLPANEDESTPSINVSVPFLFFESSYSSIYVSVFVYVCFFILVEYVKGINSFTTKVRKKTAFNNSKSNNVAVQIIKST